MGEISRIRVRLGKASPKALMLVILIINLI